MGKLVRIDRTLTPENAKERNYIFLGDVIFDYEAPAIARRDIEELIFKKNYRLGQPATRTADYIFTGLYKPMKIQNNK